MKATWNGAILAESEDTVVVEGNHYFPVDSLNQEYFADSPATSRCPWKGTANYFDVTVEGATNSGAAWIYNEPKPAAADIKNHVAFWRGVKVEA